MSLDLTAAWRIGAEAVLRHVGFTDDQIRFAGQPIDHRAHECELTPEGWDCTDDTGASRHPDSDEQDGIIECARVAIEAAAPHIAAAAWQEGYRAVVDHKLAVDTERLRAKNEGRAPSYPDWPHSPYLAEVEATP